MNGVTGVKPGLKQSKLSAARSLIQVNLIPIREFVGITYNTTLRELEASAIRRHARAHEYGHVLCDHKGDLFVRWRAQREPGGFDRWLDRVQERQCEHVAAYLLVPLKALEGMAGLQKSHIARVLDVPEHLVELRWEIWRKWGQ